MFVLCWKCSLEVGRNWASVLVWDNLVGKEEDCGGGETGVKRAGWKGEGKKRGCVTVVC